MKKFLLGFLLAVTVSAFGFIGGGIITHNHSGGGSGGILTSYERVICNGAPNFSSGVTTSEVIMATCVVPGGALGNTGRLHVVSKWVTVQAAAGGVTPNARYNVQPLGQASLFQTGGSGHLMMADYWQINNGSGYGTVWGIGPSNSAQIQASPFSAPVAINVDSTVDRNLTINCTKGTATDTCTLVAYYVSVVAF